MQQFTNAPLKYLETNLETKEQLKKCHLGYQLLPSNQGRPLKGLSIYQPGQPLCTAKL